MVLRSWQHAHCIGEDEWSGCGELEGWMSRLELTSQPCVAASVCGWLLGQWHFLYIPVAVFAFRTDDAELQKRVMSQSRRKAASVLPFE